MSKTPVSPAGRRRGAGLRWSAALVGVLVVAGVALLASGVLHRGRPTATALRSTTTTTTSPAAPSTARAVAGCRALPAFYAAAAGMPATAAGVTAVVTATGSTWRTVSMLELAHAGTLSTEASTLVQSVSLAETTGDSGPVLSATAALEHECATLGLGT